jgi:hypothetical protein
MQPTYVFIVAHACYSLTSPFGAVTATVVVSSAAGADDDRINAWMLHASTARLQPATVKLDGLSHCNVEPLIGDVHCEPHTLCTCYVIVFDRELASLSKHLQLWRQLLHGRTGNAFFRLHSELLWNHSYIYLLELTSR